MRTRASRSASGLPLRAVRQAWQHYASLKKEDDPYTIDLARAVFLIEEKEEIARNRIIKEFEGSDIQVLNGRFGPYISDGKMNGKIPKDREPASLTLAEVQQLMEETGKPVRKGFGAKKAAAKRHRPRGGSEEGSGAEEGCCQEGAGKEGGEEGRKEGPAKKAVKKAAAKSRSTPCVDEEVQVCGPTVRRPPLLHAAGG